MHILIAEDNPTNAKVLQKLLTRLEHTNEMAVNGLDALVKMRESGPFDAILMDLQMPEMDGFDAARAIVGEFEVCPPIIACTANAFPNDRLAAKEAGMVGFLAKPLTVGALDSVLKGIEPGPAGETETEIDWEHFEMVMDGGDEELIEIFNDFCVMVPKTLHLMHTAKLDEAWKTLASQAHQLKGTFSTFGLAGLSRKMSDLEQAALNGPVLLDAEWLEQSKEEFRSAENRLREKI